MRKQDVVNQASFVMAAARYLGRPMDDLTLAVGGVVTSREVTEEGVEALNQLRQELVAKLAIQERMAARHLDAII